MIPEYPDEEDTEEFSQLFFFQAQLTTFLWKKEFTTNNQMHLRGQPIVNLTVHLTRAQIQYISPPALIQAHTHTWTHYCVSSDLRV